MRDVIVLSGWSWETFNVPERMALALARSGARVLYCENPVSFFRRNGRSLVELEERVFGFGPEFLGHRLNALPLLPQVQAKLIANQILQVASQLKLQDALVIYPHGEYLPLCREFKRRGIPLVHVCMDFPEADQDELIRLSEMTLVIPRSVFEPLRERFGEKIRLIPQFSSLDRRAPVTNGDLPLPPELANIPRPRLGYLGNIESRVCLKLLEELLSSHPDWHFVSFGTRKCLALPNEHVLSWRPQRELPIILAGLDVGLMPYDCSTSKNLHCVPLKLFDYFSVGMPVVSTPILNLASYQDVIYFGNTSEELARGILLALEEPQDNFRGSRRIEIASEHSLENLQHHLAPLLKLGGLHPALAAR